MNNLHSIAIFGGTFDPIHYGHLKTSLRVQSYFNFNDYYFLPCKQPAMKLSTLANTTQRVAMLQLALEEYPIFKLDLREIERDGMPDAASYMIDTLESFREEYPASSITLVIGYDAFLSLPKWHRWHEILNISNLLVINRDSWAEQSLDQSLEKLLASHNTPNLLDVLDYSYGNIAFFDAGNFNISSTEIRTLFKQHRSINLLPKKVQDYILQENLYFTSKN